MPRGSQPGERRGGRQRGTLNRKTLERQQIAAQLAANVPAHMVEGAAGALAKDVLRFWMNEFDRLARHHRRRDAAKSKSYADAAIACAAKLAPFESPTFRAVVLA